MKNQKGYTVAELFVVILVVSILSAWIGNAVKFASCDFESNYKCEAIHAIGIFVPPTSLVTVWFDSDKSNQ